MNIGNRLVDHLVYNSTNGHLQSAFTSYGLENFTFCVVELYSVDPEVALETNKAKLLVLEQKHLDWLFSLPAELRYNFNPIAGSSLGYKHTDDTRAQISDSKSGALNPMFEKTHTEETRAQMSESQQLVDRSGANNPMYGKTHTQETRVKISASMTGKTHSEETRAKMSDANKGANNPISIQVNVVSAVNNQLEHSFSSQVACGKWLGVSEGTVRNYIKSGKVFRKQYLIVRSP
jgi:group I intron endonuclease